ncbi:trans-aconitate 2-methyltransferase [Actinophytocola algeriensis]|uniref:Trans-aconitate 2-methyltransferase n=1 Tax=Actinophytocola algeriensis TaxID=1768010 RepID=A0A7W7Q6Y6_9PSEU|nr:trans-aconitate 2-methyltransferase [Actinophytocola algeriensis]MBB4908222.1 trans-aconitate 2-methyltransferase [Actinophytocola algeriensis]MBE1480252.1 trans-aconitate 2-methyltransferase [Actinophytocola algeriensis]
MWDPSKYLTFADHRSRPFFDLVGRITADSPRRVVDLGCGPGNLTAALAQRWPSARIEASDSSPEMVAAARERGIDASVLDVRDWQPAPDTDVVVSNAVLQWVPGHEELPARWAKQLPHGAWLAFQVPGNFGAPSHVRVRELAASPRWRDRLESLVLREDDAVLDPGGYAGPLSDAGCAVDAWETTYLQRLTGDDPVLEWVTGTALRPIRTALSDVDWAEFRAELAPLLRADYPQREDGTTWFPFRRVFVVAQTP